MLMWLKQDFVFLELHSNDMDKFYSNKKVTLK